MRYGNNSKKKVEDPLWAAPINEQLTGDKLVIIFKKLNDNAKTPEYKTKDAAGMDLASAETCVLKAGTFLTVSTGLAMELPTGYEMQIRSRSGLASKNGVVVLNSPATIDADYRGELKVILINHGKEDFKIEVGDRIAQMVIAQVEQPTITITLKELTKTERGSGGLGSTGIK
jgi:dUTP pyrophosphatase